MACTLVLRPAIPSLAHMKIPTMVGKLLSRCDSRVPNLVMIAFIIQKYGNLSIADELFLEDTITLKCPNSVCGVCVFYGSMYVVKILCIACSRVLRINVFSKDPVHCMFARFKDQCI